MSSVSKKEKDLYKSLDKLYIKNKSKIISWLDELKEFKSDDGKIPGLLNNSKIQILTATEDGTYNLILQWIKNNADKFADYDFTGIPNSAFISSADLLDGPARSSKVPLTFKTVEDVKRWLKDPEKHPIKGTPMPAMSNEYYNIYETAYNIMKKYDFKSVEMKYEHDVVRNHFPKNHLLFGDIDLVYYACVKKNVKFFSRLYEGRENVLAICKLLTEKLEDTADTDNVLDTEIELLRNRFNREVKPTPLLHLQKQSNMVLIKELINEFRGDLTNAFFDTNYMSMYEYPERVKAIQENVYNVEGYWFIKFLETNKMANGETPIKYFINVLKKPSPPNWISEALKLYNSYKLLIKDIDECFNPASGIVENVEDKKLTLIDDPLDEYFEVYEQELEEIRKPIYSNLIDLTTFKPKENLKYLNNAQYAEFKAEKDRYDELWENYKEAQESYEKDKGGSRGSSPKPPIKPTITLPWGTVHTIGRQIDPVHIKDEVIVKFREEYTKAQPIIEEYNTIKNMSYKELMYHVGDSPSSSKKRFIESNELLAMTKEQITNDVLYDYSGLADKCSESIDILTNEELNDENYPLSKLQLMVRMKVYTPDKKKYRTECIYAPKLYNYLIKCINNKEPFINPVTKAKYTQENIEELMKVMRIIDPSLEVPVYIKHMNDTMLKLEYRVITEEYNDLDSSFGDINIIRYYNIYLSRSIGYKEYEVYNICTIPADIEAGGIFATGSSDLTSEVMLFGIYRLFNEGRLLHQYIPPYRIEYMYEGTLEYSYIKPEIHFNQYYDSKMWIPLYETTKEDFINMFKHYAEEVKNYLY
jgi:hypothetical protein